MIVELIAGLGAVAVAFFLLLSLCVALGKTAGYFSAYQDRK